MDANEIALAHEYMRACILAHNPRDTEHWDTETVHKVFKTLPAAGYCSFATWKGRINPEIPDSSPAGPTQEEIDRANDIAIARIEGLKKKKVHG